MRVLSKWLKLKWKVWNACKHWINYVFQRLVGIWKGTLQTDKFRACQILFPKHPNVRHIYYSRLTLGFH